MNYYTCCEYCQSSNNISDTHENIQIHSNIKKFKNEIFTVWRCSSCKTLHAKESVDLSYYYKDYPLNRIDPNAKPGFLRDLPSIIRLKRLVKYGFRKHNTLIDYGCGGGTFISFLKRQGYLHVNGYDKYGDHFNDDAVLKKKYDFVVSQDVIEHVENPFETFAELSSFLAPQGVLCIGTPNADKINLSNPMDYIQQLHQPFHRHILSEKILKRMADENNLKIIKIYHRSYFDSMYPFVNQRFVTEFLKMRDNVLDDFDENPIKLSEIFKSSRLSFYAFFGYFFSHKPEITLILKK